MATAGFALTSGIAGAALAAARFATRASCGQRTGAELIPHPVERAAALPVTPTAMSRNQVQRKMRIDVSQYSPQESNL